jgi:transcriptional regulator with XRE-family HTH domain
MRWIDRALQVAKSKGITQNDIAKAVGVEPPRVSQWKRGEGKPYLDQAAKVARLLGVSLDWLAAEDTAGDMQVPTAAGGPMLPDQALILRAIELMNLSPAEALERITRDGPGKGSPHSVKVLSEAKLPGEPHGANHDMAPRRGK